MEKSQLDELLTILNIILELKDNKIELIRKFQNQIWNINESNIECEILNELAYDLDYYEPDLNLRKEDPSYYGEDILLHKIKSTINRLNVSKKQKND